MCFSAEASFAAGVALLPAGVYCARIASQKRLSYLPLAVIPFFFSFQQFAEGFVWIGLARNDPTLVTTSSLVFLAIALGFWPFWIPFSVLFIEDRKKVRLSLTVGALLGLTLGCVLYVPLMLNPDDWLRVEVVHHSIRYNPDGLPAFGIFPHDFWDAAYGIAVLTPFFLVADAKRFVVFRVLLVASAALAFLIFREAFVSVWCFFAAWLSIHLCFLIARLEDPKGDPILATSSL